MFRSRLLCLVIAGSAIAPINSGECQRRSISQDFALATPLDGGYFSPAIYVNVGAKHRFHLETSWIPGKDHKGMFRYKVFVSPTDSAVDHVAKPDFFTPSAIAEQMKRIQGCSIDLVLYDRGGFILRRVYLALGIGVNSDGEITGLYANSAEQMDASEYRQFTNTGSWALNWDCPGQ